MRFHILALCVLALLTIKPIRGAAGASPTKVDKLTEYEISLPTEKSHANPYLDVTLSAVFKGPSRTIKASGFWDGGKLFKIRMLPTEPGKWTWTVHPTIARLVASRARSNASIPTQPAT